MSKQCEQGICPQCGSENLDYDAIEYSQDGAVYYPWTCQDCGTQGVEYYDIVFCDIESNDGTVGYDEGVCPICGEYVEYFGTSEVNGDQLIYSYDCPKCENPGTELYNMEFDNQYFN